jgi:hypothetical protein
MSLARAPGKWRWEDRGPRGWWRIHDQLQIEDGPHFTCALDLKRGERCQRQCASCAIWWPNERSDKW